MRPTSSPSGVGGFRSCPKRADGGSTVLRPTGKATSTARCQRMEKEGARSGRYPVAGGVLAVATCIFLAVVLLTADAARAGDTALAQRLRLQPIDSRRSTRTSSMDSPSVVP